MTYDDTNSGTPHGSDRFWMRPVSFLGLLKVLHALNEFPKGLKAADLNAIIRDRALYQTERGAPSATTLYHCRNTLLRLRAVQKSDSRYCLNQNTSQVRTLLSQPASDTEISASARSAFAELVLANEDCRACFFDLFMVQSSFRGDEFRQVGTAVTWNRVAEDNKRSCVQLEGASGKKLLLSSPAQIKSILYGVRYWAREELHLIDEFFREDRGAILYPIFEPTQKDVPDTIDDILRCMTESNEWTTLSLSDLAVICCEHAHRPLDILRTAIRELTARHPGQVVLVPTSRAFATISTRSRQREEIELRAYFRDAQNRYISHIKLHKSLLGIKQCRAI